MILSIWEGAYRTIGWKSWVFPAPSHVVDATLRLMNIRTAFGAPLSAHWPLANVTRSAGAVYSSPIVTANLISGLRLLEGFGLSLLLGTTLGALMWRWRELDELLGPVFLGVQTLPSVCWVPLGILAFGINEKGILFVMVMGSMFAVSIAMRDGLRTIPSIYHRAGLMMGARGWRLYRYVIIPASLPAMASSLRQGFSFAWRSLMGAEFLLWTDQHGVGYLLHQGREFNDVAQVIAIMGVMVFIGMLADRWVFAQLQKRVQARFGLA
jgi:NitT/TauT family transport system permease protein